MHISFKLYICIYKADFLESGKKANKLLFYGIEIYNFPQELKDKFQDKFCLFLLRKHIHISCKLSLQKIE